MASHVTILSQSQELPCPEPGLVPSLQEFTGPLSSSESPAGPPAVPGAPSGSGWVPCEWGPICEDCKGAGGKCQECRGSGFNPNYTQTDTYAQARLEEMKELCTHIEQAKGVLDTLWCRIYGQNQRLLATVMHGQRPALLAAGRQPITDFDNELKAIGSRFQQGTYTKAEENLLMNMRILASLADRAMGGVGDARHAQVRMMSQMVRMIDSKKRDPDDRNAVRMKPDREASVPPAKRGRLV